jgi:hypothetical protein
MLSAAGDPLALRLASALPHFREWQLSRAGQVTDLPVKRIRPIIRNDAPAVRNENCAPIICNGAPAICNEDCAPIICNSANGDITMRLSEEDACLRVQLAQQETELLRLRLVKQERSPQDMRNIHSFWQMPGSIRNHMM